LKVASGLSEAKLSEKSSVPRGTLHTYIMGSREPSFFAVVKLARALNVSVEAFADCVERDAGATTPPKRPGGTPEGTRGAPGRARAEAAAGAAPEGKVSAAT
jgi:hypothetical protein